MSDKREDSYWKVIKIVALIIPSAISLSTLADYINIADSINPETYVFDIIGFIVAVICVVAVFFTIAMEIVGDKKED